MRLPKIPPRHIIKSGPLAMRMLPLFRPWTIITPKTKTRHITVMNTGEWQNYYLTKKQTIVTVQDAVPASFVSIKEDYAKDSKRGYFKGVGFNVKDVASLSVVQGQFVKDKYQVYFQQRPV